MKLMQRFTVKNIIFLAVIAAVLVVVGMLTVPLVLSVHIFGIRSLVTAPFYALVGTIALLKVKKPGALAIAGTLNGLVLLMMSPVMFVNQVFGSCLAELIALLVFRSYDKPASAQLAATLYIPLTLPLSILSNMWIAGATLSDLVENPAVALGVSLGTVLLSILGGFLGRRLGAELKKAGKLT